MLEVQDNSKDPLQRQEIILTAEYDKQEEGGSVKIWQQDPKDYTQTYTLRENA